MDQQSKSDQDRPQYSHRSHTSLPKITTTSPNPDATASQKRHHHIHREKHHHHHHRQPKDVIQSAIQLHPPSSFGEPRKHGIRSRGHSPAPSANDGKREASTSTNPVLEHAVRPTLIRPEDVEWERQRAKARDEEIRSTLHTLSEKSLDTTRRLDDTYYSILERLTLLSSTINSLQELSSLSKELNHNFENDSVELRDEVQGQIDAFEGFGNLKDRVGVVVERIHVIKTKCGSLSERLQTANKRVEARENSEAARQQKADKRARVIKWVMAFVAPILLSLVLFYQFYILEPDAAQAALLPRNSQQSVDLEDLNIPPDAKEILRNARASLYAKNTSTPILEASVSPSNDARLKQFDEL